MSEDFWEKKKQVYRKKYSHLSSDRLRTKLDNTQMFCNSSAKRGDNIFSASTQSEAVAICEAIHGLLAERA